MRFCEDSEKNITDIEHRSVGDYLKKLSMQHISAESYNNKLRVISSFLHYLQVTDCIGEFSNPILLYYKKRYPVVNEIDNLDQKLDLLTSHLGEFPDNLRVMSLTNAELKGSCKGAVLMEGRRFNAEAGVKELKDWAEKYN